MTSKDKQDAASVSFNNIRNAISECADIGGKLVEGRCHNAMMDCDGRRLPMTNYSFRFDVGNGYKLDISWLEEYNNLNIPLISRIINIAKHMVIKKSMDFVMDSFISHNYYGSYGYDLFVSRYEGDGRQAERFIDIYGKFLDPERYGRRFQTYRNYSIFDDMEYSGFDAKMGNISYEPTNSSFQERTGYRFCAVYKYEHRFNSASFLFTNETHSDVMIILEELETEMENIHQLIRNTQYHLRLQKD